MSSHLSSLSLQLHYYFSLIKTLLFIPCIKKLIYLTDWSHWTGWRGVDRNTGHGWSWGDHVCWLCWGRPFTGKTTKATGRTLVLHGFTNCRHFPCIIHTVTLCSNLTNNFHITVYNTHSNFVIAIHDFPTSDSLVKEWFKCVLWPGVLFQSTLHQLQLLILLHTEDAIWAAKKCNESQQTI